MQYPDGKDVKLGDRVRLGNDATGVVVCSIDDDAYSSEHPREQWRYLEKGVVIEFATYGLIHVSEPDPDLERIP